MDAALPLELRSRLDAERSRFEQRLAEFASVDPSQWFYEFCFCLCTPQSAARNALHVVEHLKHIHFFEQGGDVEPVLGNPAHYIRFHRTKAKRLLQLRSNWKQIEDILGVQGSSAQDTRERIRHAVSGYGMKESSHVLRNIGYRNLAILDRHLLTNLVRCGVFRHPPKIGSSTQYLEVELAFRSFCAKIGEDMDVIDLLFWSEQTGEVLK